MIADLQRHAPTKAAYSRYFPCPWCKGAGGENEPVPGVYGDGPRYDCSGCNGSGDGRDYVRLRDERAAQYADDVKISCECGHDATRHYESAERCAWDGEIDDDELPRHLSCPCARSRATVIAAFAAPKADEPAGELTKKESQ